MHAASPCRAVLRCGPQNTLMRVAVDKVEGWENLKPATKGDNAWLFVNEEVRWPACHGLAPELFSIACGMVASGCPYLSAMPPHFA